MMELLQLFADEMHAGTKTCHIPPEFIPECGQDRQIIPPPVALRCCCLARLLE